MENNQAEWARQLAERGISIKTLTEKERAEREREEAIKYTAQLASKKRRLFKSYSQMPHALQNGFKFNDWQPGRQSDEQLARSVGKQAFELSKALKEDSFNVFFYGTAGSGKTSLALAMMNMLDASGKTTMFVSVVDWLALKYRSFSDERAANQLHTMERLMEEVDVLTIDDLGKDSQKEAKETMAKALFMLANNRSGKTTIITSNENPSELTNKYDVATISRLIPRNMDRIISMNGLQDVREV